MLIIILFCSVLAGMISMGERRWYLQTPFGSQDAWRGV